MLDDVADDVADAWLSSASDTAWLAAAVFSGSTASVTA